MGGNVRGESIIFFAENKEIFSSFLRIENFKERKIMHLI